MPYKYSRSIKLVVSIFLVHDIGCLLTITFLLCQYASCRSAEEKDGKNKNTTAQSQCLIGKLYSDIGSTGFGKILECDSVELILPKSVKTEGRKNFFAILRALLNMFVFTDTL